MGGRSRPRRRSAPPPWLSLQLSKREDFDWVGTAPPAQPPLDRSHARSGRPENELVLWGRLAEHPLYDGAALGVGDGNVSVGGGHRAEEDGVLDDALPVDEVVVGRERPDVLHVA